MHRILLAEDNRLNQIVAVGVLRNLGYEVDVVHDGTDAVNACLEVLYDAVVMDVMMPNLDGYEATAAIRDHEAVLHLPPVPVIGLSARSIDGDREIALAAGMDEYLTKPLRTWELEAALTRWIAVPSRQEQVLDVDPETGRPNLRVVSAAG